MSRFSSFIRITPFKAWSAFVGWALVIFYLSSLTSTDLEVMPSELLAQDKLVHALAYSVGGIFLGIALRQTSRLRGIWLFAASAVGIGLFGASDELHQLFTPGRSGADFYDWIADMVGGSCAAFVYCWFHGNSARSSGPNPTTP
ncbi:MAG: VanZ family protein [Chthoniobacterales bacterium]